MKVLFCSPYLQKEGIVKGGINVWGHNILEYYKTQTAPLDLIPVSFDRIYNVQEDTGVLTRFVYGIKDYWASISTANKKMSQEKVDVLHLCTSAQLSLFKDLFLLKLAHRKGVKTAVHFHFGRIPEVLKFNNWEGKMIRRVCNNSDSIIVMDQKSYITLLKEGYNNVAYLPNPLSTTVIEQIDSLETEIKRIKNKIVYVGHVIPSKGVYELVEGCARVDGIELHLIGTIDEKVKNDLTEIAAAKQSGSWLHIRGGIPHDDVIKEMLSAAIFMLPSYTEGFPFVILESMACRCAIVATPVGAIPEMLKFGEKNKCGLECTVKDVDSVTNCINSLFQQEGLMEELTANAKNRVLNSYAMPVVWRNLENIWLNTK